MFKTGVNPAFKEPDPEEKVGRLRSPPECCEYQSKEGASQAEGERRGPGRRPVTGDVWAEPKPTSRGQVGLYFFPLLP